MSTSSTDNRSNGRRRSRRRSLFRLFWDSLENPRYGKPLLDMMLILSLLLATLILAPGIRLILDGPEPTAEEQRHQAVLLTDPVTPEPTVAPILEEEGNWHRLDDELYFIREDGGLATGLCRIDGKLYFFSPEGKKAASLGVDVSYYNEKVDWKAVRQQGIDFALIRAGARGWSYGGLYEDTRCMEYLREASAAGLKVGVYYYSTAVNASEAVQEAETVLRRLSGFALDYPIYLDLEYSGEYPEGRSDLLSKEQRAEIVEAFCSTVESAGYESGIYSGQHYWKYELPYDVLNHRSVWLASYTKNYAMPGFERRYDIWQFTDRGIVKGMPGPIDMNVIF